MWLQVPGTYHIAINEWSTTRDCHLELYCSGAEFLEYNVKESSIFIPADAVHALAVGATYWKDDSLESFSSQGPTNDGRIKPDICAPDGVGSFIYGSFFGTSASTPHIAGASALVKSQNPDFNTDQIRCFLESNAIDLGAAGKDNLFGSGRISLISGMVKAYPIEYKYDKYRFYTVDGKRYFENTMYMRIQNDGPGKALDVKAQISTDPGYKPVSLTINDGDVSFGDIAVGSSKWSMDILKVTVDLSTMEKDDIFYVNILYKDTCGNLHVIRNVRQLPAPAAPPLAENDRMPLWYPQLGLKPTVSKLYSNYPNPFNPETWIPYQVADSCRSKCKDIRCQGTTYNNH